MKNPVMKYNRILFYLVVFTLSMIVVPIVSCGEKVHNHDYRVLGNHEVVIDSLSWTAFSVNCQIGERISGSFQVRCDGSLYPGDEQKYDDWVPENIQFYILNEVNYLLFTESQDFNASYYREDISKLDWSFQIPASGNWYILYYNNSIYMMTVIGVINSTHSFDLLLIIIIGFACCLSIVLVSRYLVKEKR